MRPVLKLSITTLGFTAMASQIVYMRELLIVFYGNELSIAYMLAGWLAAGGIGAWVTGKVSDKATSPLRLFAICQAAVALILPAGLCALRHIRPALGLNAGEIFPPVPILWASFILLAPLCGTLGFLFTLSCRISGGISRPYLYESMGAVAGGVSAGIFLMPAFGPFRILFLAGLANLVMSLALLISIPRPRPRGVILAVMLALTAAVSALFINLPERMDRVSAGSSWPGYRILDSGNSIYGNITVLGRSDQVSIFENGLRLFTIPDDQQSEEAVNFALLQHPDPRDVLLVGGGAGGPVLEISKHPVKTIDYLELDPMVIGMTLKHAPAGYGDVLADPRVTVKNVDGRSYLKKPDRKYDCIIINVGDPYTAQVNRYYTVEFYRDAAKALNAGGVLSFGVSASESYINDDQADLLGSLYMTLNEAFDDIRAIPGETVYFIAATEPGALTYDPKILVERASSRGLDLRYIREYYLYNRMAPDKISYLLSAIRGRGTLSSVNRDMKPISYYHNIVCWSGRFRDSALSRILRTAKAGGLPVFLASVYCMGLVSMSYVLRRARRRLAAAAVFSVASTGFGVMAMQIVVLLAFQVTYGYLFYRLGLILTAFMGGIAAGGYAAVKTVPDARRDKQLMVFTQSAMALYPLLAFLALSRPLQGLFIAMPFLAGFIGGFQFPLAGRICAEGSNALGGISGRIYGGDLTGSCFGALLTGSLLIPVLGIPGTCGAVFTVSLGSLLLYLAGRRYES